MNCPICNTEIEEHAKKCPVCGYRLAVQQVQTECGSGQNKRSCPVCQAPVARGDFVCPLCGVSVEDLWEEEVPEASGPNVRKEEVPEASGPNIRKEEPVQKAPAQKSKGGGKKWIAVLTVLCVLIGAGIAVGVMYRLNRSETTGGPAVEPDAITAQNDLPDPGMEPEPDEETESEEPEETQDPFDEETEEPEETQEPLWEEAEEPEDGEAEPICIEDYCGAWNIGSSVDRELMIQKITDDVLAFSLYYYRLDSIENVIAPLENNIARFSYGSGAEAVEGALIFDEESVVVQIADSGRVYMPAEMMVFDEWHEYLGKAFVRRRLDQSVRGG